MRTAAGRLLRVADGDLVGGLEDASLRIDAGEGGLPAADGDVEGFARLDRRPLADRRRLQPVLAEQPRHARVVGGEDAGDAGRQRHTRRTAGGVDES